MKTPHFSQALCSAVVLISLCAPGFSQIPIPQNPVDTFVLSPPADPPSGPAAVAPVAFVNGSYSDSSYLGGGVDMTMDESGKVLAMGAVDGFTDKSGANQVQRKGAVKTINGVPYLMGSASVSGTYASPSVPGIVAAVAPRPLSGSGSVKIPLGPAQQTTDFYQPVVTSSHTGRFAGDPDNDKPSSSVLSLEKTQVANIVDKSWSMKVILAEKFDSKGKPYNVVSVDLKKPDGTRTIFKEKRVRFSETNGYSFALAGGTDVNPITGVPKLDGKGKPVIDRKSRISFSKLMFKKFFNAGNQPYWEPAAGAVTYRFLGQKGFGQLFNFNIS